MKPSKVTSEQWLKVGKAAAYAAASAAISVILLYTTDNPLVFGAVLTPIVNSVLVALKQVFTPANEDIQII
jgi:hypothetical protein